MTPADAVQFSRALRERYDALPRGDKATLRRCATADELRLEGIYWRLVDDAGLPEDSRARTRMAYVVCCFGAAEAGGESFARWLRRHAFGDVGPADLPARALRFRRLLAAGNRDELVRLLRALLKHGFQESRAGVEWGELGKDIFFWGDQVRRRWAEQFFTNAESQTEDNRHA